MEYFEDDWIYDIETYPNCFTFCIVHASGKHLKVYEISDRKNEIEGLLKCFRYLRKNKQRLVGFNNVGFDYPVIHRIIDEAAICKQMGSEVVITAEDLYRIAQEQIDSFRGAGFGNTIRQSEEWIKQVDLYKIHHFDNKARSTSLKMLEFNMRSETVDDLPFDVGKVLTEEEMDVLVKYNKKDVLETLKFYYETVPAIEFREKLTEKYGFDCTNYNDTKIGKEYFISRLESHKRGTCYEYTRGGRKLRQSKRDSIKIKECLFDYYDFQFPEYKAVQDWLSKQVITETKGVFSDILESDLGELAEYAELTTKRKRFKGKPSEKEIAEFKSEYPMGWIEEQELKAKTDKLDENGNPVFETVVLKSGKIKQKKVKVPKISYWKCWKVAETLNTVHDGFRSDFGTGGIHGSIESAVVKEGNGYIIRDWDVASMYPNIAIANNVYPEHLGFEFCPIYLAVYKERKSYSKDKPENAALKLALNGVYGDSNNQYSPFYDPKYTMSITINGQLSLLLLTEMLKSKIDDFMLIQQNTDGITAKFPEGSEELADQICKEWEQITGLELEKANYSKMIIRDVNNYIAIYENGGIKRKGAYAWKTKHHVDNPKDAELGWHQNHSALIIPMAVEQAMLNGVDYEEFIRNHKDPYDFMLRTKVPRSSRLVWRFEDGFEKPLQNICRYYPSESGGKLIKIMPPLEEGGDEREIGIDTQYNVIPCNDINNFNWNINYDYYFKEVEKLLITEEI